MRLVRTPCFHPSPGEYCIHVTQSCWRFRVVFVEFRIGDVGPGMSAEILHLEARSDKAVPQRVPGIMPILPAVTSFYPLPSGWPRISAINPHFSPAFCCCSGSGHVCSIALRRAPGHTVQYACGALGRAPCIHARLHRLVTKSDEKSGLRAALQLDCKDKGRGSRQEVG
jgi:hypothetical protein